MKIITPFIIITSLLLSACAQTPSVGEQMLTAGSDTQNLGKKWNKGNKLVAKGLKNTTEGESMIKKGNTLAAHGAHKRTLGQRMIKKGNALMQKSEETFQTLSQAPAENLQEA